VTSISEIDGSVIIQWQEPDSHSSDISDYTVELQNKLTEVWSEDNTYCLSTVETRECYVPMSVFTSQLDYELLDVVAVRVTAHNEKG
jgi:hypothetical protein